MAAFASGQQAYAQPAEEETQGACNPRRLENKVKCVSEPIVIVLQRPESPVLGRANDCARESQHHDAACRRLEPLEPWIAPCETLVAGQTDSDRQPAFRAFPRVAEMNKAVPAAQARLEASLLVGDEDGAAKSHAKVRCPRLSSQVANRDIP